MLLHRYLLLAARCPARIVTPLSVPGMRWIDPPVLSDFNPVIDCEHRCLFPGPRLKLVADQAGVRRGMAALCWISGCFSGRSRSSSRGIKS